MEVAGVLEEIRELARTGSGAGPYYLPIGDEVEVFAACHARGLAVMLKGPTGCGKTRFVEHMAWRLGRPLVTVACHDDLAANDLTGRYLLVGGENSWFYVVRLNRGYDRQGKVRVRPRVVARVPSWDGRLLAARGDRAFSIESSVAYDRGIAYFANSAGLVQGWDVRPTLRRGKPPRRVFRFWMGDDTDASVVIDEKGFLYVASELERFTGRSKAVGQLVKLDPRRPRAPLVWSVPLRAIGRGGKGGEHDGSGCGREEPAHGVISCCPHD